MLEPLSTHESLLDGAREQFSRHGFAKTSMADIAEAAGISRTALYHHFSNKEEIFKALSRRINESVYEAVVAAVQKDGAWQDRLRGLIHARVGWVYELLHASEYGRELINEKNRLCGGEVHALNDRFEALIADLLQPHSAPTADNLELARVLVLSVNGILEQATSRSTAEHRVAVLVSLFCKGLKG